MTDVRSADPAPAPVVRATGRLRAVRRTLEVDPGFDPLDLAEEPDVVFHTARRTLVGVGTALTLPLPGGLETPGDLARAHRDLAAVACHDESGRRGSGVVAFGSFPFDRSAPTALVVPHVLVGVDDEGPPWVTVVSPDGERPPADARALRRWLAGRRGPGNPAAASPGTIRRSEVEVRPLGTAAEFLAMVEDALRRIDEGELVKVVLARHVEVRATTPFDVRALLARWRRLEPTCTVFSLPAGDGRFVGASPELLVERCGDRVRSRPLAGTTGRSPDATGRQPADLLGSPKDADEHRHVVEAIGSTLATVCTELDVPDRPALVHLHSITHLGTTVTGTLRRPDGRPGPTALDLVALLHPTPAVGGVPTAPALETIHRLEPADRGHYAGAVGWVDADGDGEWVVGIRAVTVAGRDARLAVGVGIVGASDPAAELRETDLKLAAVLDALAPDRATPPE